MKGHANVAVFVPHVGCQHGCSFCNQHILSGTPAPPRPEELADTFVAALQSLGERARGAQIAFFGGSFTAAEPRYRRALLQAARPFVGSEGFGGIRVSTRPDCVDEAIVAELGAYGVTAVELGAQSMDDRVLAANRRGHTAGDTVAASRRIKGAGLELGLQMMTGLYGDDDAGAMATAQALAALDPDTVRIYPVLVLRSTPLHRLYEQGAYRPQTLEGAIALGARLLRFFREKGIPVIRLGLHEEPGLAENTVAGPHHPALGELCQSRLLLGDALGQLEGIPKGAVALRVHPRSVSKMAGQRRENLRRLGALGYNAKIRPDPGQEEDRVSVEQI